MSIIKQALYHKSFIIKKKNKNHFNTIKNINLNSDII